MGQDSVRIVSQGDKGLTSMLTRRFGSGLFAWIEVSPRLNLEVCISVQLPYRATLNLVQKNVSWTIVLALSSQERGSSTEYGWRHDHRDGVKTIEETSKCIFVAMKTIEETNECIFVF